MKMFMTLVALMFSLSVSAAKIQTDGIVTATDCTARGIANSACLPKATQVWDTVNSQLLSTTLGSLVTTHAPTQQKFLTGSGTYTRPTSPTPLYIRVRMIGGGGGGAGGGASSGNGTAGGNTTFGTSLLTANGGAGGIWDNAGPAGGSATIGAGATGIALQGGYGNPGNSNNLGAWLIGGNGCTSPFGGAGGAGTGGQNGITAIQNTGSGGGGGGTLNITGHQSGSGGACGGYIDAIITSPASTYSYSVGSQGVGSSTNGDFNGGDGSLGLIIVDEYYQ